MLLYCATQKELNYQAQKCFGVIWESKSILITNIYVLIICEVTVAKFYSKIFAYKNKTNTNCIFYLKLYY